MLLAARPSRHSKWRLLFGPFIFPIRAIILMYLAAAPFHRGKQRLFFWLSVWPTLLKKFCNARGVLRRLLHPLIKRSVQVFMLQWTPVCSLMIETSVSDVYPNTKRHEFMIALQCGESERPRVLIS